MADEALLAAAKAVLAGTISWGSGPAAPIFDEFDAEVERNRGRWAKVDGAALDRLREAVTQAEAEPDAPDAACTRKGCGRPLSEHEMGGVFCP